MADRLVGSFLSGSEIRLAQASGRREAAVQGGERAVPWEEGSRSPFEGRESLGRQGGGGYTQAVKEAFQQGFKAGAEASTAFGRGGPLATAAGLGAVHVAAA